MNTREKRFIDECFASDSERRDAYRRLEAKEPLAYILGEWYFYDEKYIVTPDVLVPQPDTEILVETAIKRLPHGIKFCDLCTGSGCAAISVLCHRADLSALAVDISPSALEIAKKNAELNGVTDRIEFIIADITEKSFSEELRSFNVGAIIGNPPYIETAVIDTLDTEVLAEPRIALDGGSDGLRFYRAIKTLRGEALKSGYIMLEIGYNQSRAVREIFGGGEIIRDYGGNNRVFIQN